MFGMKPRWLPASSRCRPAPPSQRQGAPVLAGGDEEVLREAAHRGALPALGLVAELLEADQPIAGARDRVQIVGDRPRELVSDELAGRVVEQIRRAAIGVRAA